MKGIVKYNVNCLYLHLRLRIGCVGQEVSKSMLVSSDNSVTVGTGMSDVLPIVHTEGNQTAWTATNNA